jgi:IS30 family transposase
MKQAGKEQNRMATKLHVHPSTISRELGRNTGLRGYRPKQAQQKELQRRFNACKAVKMTPETVDYIERKLAEDHSPEQIAERMKLDPGWHGPSVSHERIYQHIWQDKAGGGLLYKHLRIGGTKQRRKRRNSRDMRGMIKNRVGIEERPPIVERRIRIGDWEGDTVVGKNHQGALVTLVDRKSKLTLIGKVDRYTAQAVEKTIISLMELLPRRSYTLTVDNGKEFASHESVAESRNRALESVVLRRFGDFVPLLINITVESPRADNKADSGGVEKAHCIPYNIILHEPKNNIKHGG